MSGGWGLVAAVALGLVISEFSELSPWLAHKLIHWAARVRYPTRVEELSALIAERPGKLFKLVTASCFACAALTYRVTHRKTVPVHALTSRFWIGFGSVLVAGALMTGEYLLASVIAVDRIDLLNLLLNLVIVGTITAFIAAAELLVSSRLVSSHLSTGWATAVVTFALISISILPEGSISQFSESLMLAGWMAVVACVSVACAIRLGNRLRLSVMAASSTILGGGLLTCTAIWQNSTSASQHVDNLVVGLGFGFAFGFSVGVGLLLWKFLCGRRLSQSLPERAPRTAT